MSIKISYILLDSISNCVNIFIKVQSQFEAVQYEKMINLVFLRAGLVLGPLIVAVSLLHRLGRPDKYLLHCQSS